MRSRLGEVDTVITLCAEEVCPVYLGTARRLHWPLPDPAGARRERRGAASSRFRTVRDELRRRIGELAGRGGASGGPRGAVVSTRTPAGRAQPSVFGKLSLLDRYLTSGSSSPWQSASAGVPFPVRSRARSTLPVTVGEQTNLLIAVGPDPDDVPAAGKGEVRADAEGLRRSQDPRPVAACRTGSSVRS